VFALVAVVLVHDQVVDVGRPPRSEPGTTWLRSEAADTSLQVLSSCTGSALSNWLHLVWQSVEDAVSYSYAPGTQRPNKAHRRRDESQTVAVMATGREAPTLIEQGRYKYHHHHPPKS